MEILYYLLSQPFSPERSTRLPGPTGESRTNCTGCWTWCSMRNQFRNRKNNCPVNLALLRKLALNLVRLGPSKGSMRGKLKRAAGTTATWP